jgi:hypothetical protein
VTARTAARDVVERLRLALARRGAPADDRTRQQLERLEHYGAHLAAQNDRTAERLELLERQLADLDARAGAALETLGHEVTSRAVGRHIGVFPVGLGHELKRVVGLRRAVETGTNLGQGARSLAGIVEQVSTIELSAERCEASRRALADLPSVRVLAGDSRELLPELLSAEQPTLYWLDGHWSGGPTAGQDDQCPLLAEIALLASGHPDDCILIDDARLFVASPQQPFDASQWPSLIEVLDALRTIHPGHHVTVAQDLVIGVPPRAKAVVDTFAWQLPSTAWRDG